MLSGGDGGLSIGNIQMDQYKLLDPIKPINTRVEVEEYIKRAKAFLQELELPICVDFQITESREKRITIWYKMSEKHSL